jgi:hypothetical protein
MSFTSIPYAKLRPDDPYDDFYRQHLPEHVQARFDLLAPIIQEMFAEHVTPKDDARTFCKVRIKRLWSAKWSLDDMVDLARVYPHGFGKLYTQTFKVFAEILIELRQEAEGDYPGIAEALSATTWLQRKDPPPDRLLGDIVTTTIRMFLIGMAGLGKTMLGLAIGISMALGQSFCHWRSNRPARVLYFDGEMSRELIIQRVKDAARRTGCGETIPNLMIYSLEDAEMWAARWPKLGLFEPLNTEAGHEFVYRLCDVLKPDVCIFDNIQCLAPGVQKEEETWAGVVPLVQGLTKRRIGQIYVDHANQQGRQYGTITKGWRADNVGIMKPLEGDDAPPPEETAFMLSFDPAIGGKCRRRTPDNWQEFAPHIFRLRNDEWSSEPISKAAAKDGGLGKLKPARLPYYDALIAAIGKDTRSSNGSTTIEAWQAVCIQRGLIDPPPEGRDNRDSRLRNWRTAKSDLVTARYIVQEGNIITDIKGRW